MKIDVNVWIRSESEDRILSKLTDLIAVIMKLETKMATEMEGLIAAVAEQTTVVASNVAAWDGLRAKLDEIIAAGSKPADILALRDAVEANTQTLADAGARNTIAEGEEPTA